MTRTTSRQHRQQGSLLVLCVIVLVIIALLGLATLQQVKMDAFSVKQQKREYVDIAINQILDNMIGALGEDGREQIRGIEAYADYPATNATSSEQVDVVKEYTTVTDLDTVPVAVKANAVYLNPNTENRMPGATPAAKASARSNANQDAAKADHYLASTMPEIGFYNHGNNLATIDSDNHIWPHLTNVTGIWLDLPLYEPNLDPNVTTDLRYMRPREVAIDADINTYNNRAHASQESRDANIGFDFLLDSYDTSHYENRGVDTDGDGLPDARFQWAPEGARTIGGRKYVMALRVVDLNSLININTGSFNIVGTGYPTVPAAISDTNFGQTFGYDPSAADLTRLLVAARVGLTGTPHEKDPAATYDTDEDAARALLLKRFAFDNTMKTKANPTPLNYADRRDVWENQGSIFSQTPLQFGLPSEMELRRFGGLNDTQTEAEIESADPNPELSTVYTGLAKLLRNKPNPTAGYINESSIMTVYGVSDLADWFSGVDYRTVEVSAGTGNALNNTYPLPAIRHAITTKSGTATYTPDLGATTNAQSNLALGRSGLNQVDIKNNLVVVDIAHKVAQAFKHPATHPNFWYMNIANEAVQDDMAIQYALNIQDYSDVDIRPTLMETGTFAGVAAAPSANFYGIERLPYIKQVYVQALYEDQISSNYRFIDTNGDDIVQDTEVFDNTDAAKWADPAALGVYSTYAPVQPSGNDNETIGFAIEIGNPFSQMIRGTNTLSGGTSNNDGLDGQLGIKVQVGAGVPVIYWLNAADVVASSPGGDAFDIRAREDGNASDSLIIVFNQQNATELDSSGGGANIVADLGIPAGGAANDPRFVIINPSANDPLNTITWSNAGEIVVSLVIPSDNTPSVDIEYDIFRTGIELNNTPVERATTQFVSENLSGSARPAERAYIQYAAYRDSRAMRYLWDNGNSASSAAGFTPARNTPNTGSRKTAHNGDTALAGLFTQLYPAPADSTTTYYNNANQYEFGDDAKSTAGITAGGPTTAGNYHFDDENFELHCANASIKSMAEIAIIPQFTGVGGITGATINLTVPERLSQPHPSVADYDVTEQNRFLVLIPNAANPWFTPIDVKGGINYPATGAGVPHAALLFDLLTTSSVKNDGLDNDLDGQTDEDDEIFTPGKINVNTMPPHLLALSSPIPEPLGGIEDLTRAIAAYRDAPLYRRFTPSGAMPFDTAISNLDYDTIRQDIQGADHSISNERRDKPGITSLGELLYINPTLGASNTFNMMHYGLNGLRSNAEAGGRLDLIPSLLDSNTITGRSNVGSTGYTDQGIEEYIARFQYLSQLYTVRSDRFIVYGVVRGYTEDRFNLGPVEEARFMAIIDRGNLDQMGASYGSVPVKSPRIIDYVRID